MQIKLYNTLTRQKEVFKPIRAGEASVYTCGPTVYDYTTIGNFRSYVFADLLRRVLMFNGLNVTHVVNITDVGHLVGDGNMGEDKLEKGAAKLGKTAWEIADMFTEIYKQELDKMNILRPTVWPRATDHIEEQITFIKELTERGYTYQISDGIYFDTSKQPDYGKLAKLDIEGLKEGARVEKNEEKKNPTDFALWKFSPTDKKRDMEWESPWGVGFPGWHIECSAMGVKYLGDHFDIHTGGIDFIPLHHTNELAQNEARFDSPVVNIWMHGDFISVDGRRIGKSEGNAITVSELEGKGFTPLAYRYLLLGTHYRQKSNFTEESLQAASSAYQNLVGKLAAMKLEAMEHADVGTISASELEKFKSAINDDLNVPQGLAILWEMLSASAISSADKYATAIKFDEVLGLRLEEAVKAEMERHNDIPEEVTKLAEEREVARAENDWTRADELRAQINNLGYFIEDGDDGPRLGKSL